MKPLPYILLALMLLSFDAPAQELAHGTVENNGANGGLIFTPFEDGDSFQSAVRVRTDVASAGEPCSYGWNFNTVPTGLTLTAAELQGVGGPERDGLFVSSSQLGSLAFVELIDLDADDALEPLRDGQFGTGSTQLDVILTWNVGPAYVGDVALDAVGLRRDFDGARFCLNGTTVSSENAGGIALSQTDFDWDGIPNEQDTCVTVASPLSGVNFCDVDSDGYGGPCDGDFDQDFVTQTTDQGILFANFGLPGVTDMDCDGQTQITDFGAFAERFGKPPGPSVVDCAGTVPCVPVTIINP